MKKKILLILFFIFLTIMFVRNNKVNAQNLESQSFNGVNDANLYNLTNTFSYKYDSVTSIDFRNEERYDFSKPTGIIVDEKAPLLTVFTHGLGGSASHWSNDGNDNFAYSDNSLITRLAKLIDSNIYVIKLDDIDKLDIIDITDQFNLFLKEKNNAIYNLDKSIDKIIDISKHSIVVFQASDSATIGANDLVYTEFNYAISKIVYDIRVLNKGVLPKINLIGHSRGGITNMQYALDHPDLISSIYSLGTPYTGSTSASIDRHILKNSFSGSEEASKDITSKSVYGKYMQRWNENYNKRYSHINVMALAGYATLLNLAKGLTTEKSLDFLNYTFPNIDKKVAKIAIPTILGALNVAIIAQYFTPPIGIAKVSLSKLIYGTISELFTNLDLSDMVVDDIIQILTNELNIDYHPPFVSWYNDGLVDLGSQLGYEGLIPLDGQQYKGFKRKTKTFMVHNTDFDNISVKMPAVVHNLEARDKELGSYILADINVGQGLVDNEYELYDVGNNKVGIMAYIGKTNESTLVIPEFINGKEVVAIADYAFANNLYDQLNVNEIIIPKSVVTIGKNAFYNSDKITKISFHTESILSEIKEGAFSYMPNLASFRIGRCVNYLGENAFQHSGITNFEILNNANYSYNNGFLINKNISNNSNHIAIYANPKLRNFIVPSNVKTLASNLFNSNRNISSINLNKVEYIENDAFSNSTLSNITGGINVKFVGNSVFSYTPWLEKQNTEFVVLGKTLLKYKGDSFDVKVPHGIVQIGEKAFNNPNLKSIILPSTVENIGKEAFINSKNLKSILFTSTQAPILSENVFGSNVVLNVKESSYNYYINSVYFKKLLNQISKKAIKIEFLDKNGNSLGFKQETYGSIFNQYIDPINYVGDEFIYWIDENGNKYYKNGFLEIYKDLKLTPYYEKSKYTINVFNEDNRKIIVMTYGETLNLEIPKKSGYLFKGWYDQITGGEKVIDISGKVIWTRTNKVEYLYVQYELIRYSITYNTVHGEFIGENPKYFTAENPITTNDISEVRRFGYVFYSWFLDGKEFKTTDNVFKDITLCAYWRGIQRNYDSSTSITINDSYSIINLKNAKESDRYYFYVASSVKTITFIGDNKKFTDFEIMIGSRSNSLVMGFESMKISPRKSTTGKGTNAITNNSSVSLYLIYKNYNEIIGGEGVDGVGYYYSPPVATDNQSGYSGKNGGKAGDGGHGIEAYKVILTEYDSNSKITIIGGKGGKGGRGENGQSGSNGVQSPNGSCIIPRKGDNGSNGGRGGNGGLGGNGGYAVKVHDTTCLEVSPSGKYDFVGGAGGLGGAGGDGGAGGTGASDISGSVWYGVGDPGDGGNGGNGGNGGAGGNGSFATNVSHVCETGGAGGDGGKYGQGGNAGLGGSAGDKGENGKEGTGGSTGYWGSSGKRAKSKNNTSGSGGGGGKIGYFFNISFLTPQNHF